MLGALGAPMALYAQIPAGQVVERITYRDDTTQHFALYAPPQYDPSKAWPVVFLMDPRGRAMVPLNLFKRGAERFGYVLVSSYNTVSDSSVEPNDNAVDAMLRWTQRTVKLDPNRVYFAGFSGTARMSWNYALAMSPTAGGIITFGGGLFNPYSIVQAKAQGASPFPVFGGAGITDFNYEEMRRLPGQVGPYGYPVRVVFYPGGHAWPPEPVAFQSLEWMHLHAMKRSFVPRDQRWIDSLYDARFSEAAHVDSIGASTDAIAAWGSLADDFKLLHDVTEPVRRAALLSEVRRARQDVDRRAGWAKQEQDYRVRLERTLETLRADRKYPDADRVARDLGIEALHKRADTTTSSDTADAHAAQRILEVMAASFSFYGPRSVLRSDPARALVMADVALRIRPNDRGSCAMRARALVLLQRRDEAKSALDCAIRNGMSESTVKSDSLLSTLRPQ